MALSGLGGAGNASISCAVLDMMLLARSVVLERERERPGVSAWTGNVGRDNGCGRVAVGVVVVCCGTVIVVGEYG